MGIFSSGGIFSAPNPPPTTGPSWLGGGARGFWQANQPQPDGSLAQAEAVGTETPAYEPPPQFVPPSYDDLMGDFNPADLAQSIGYGEADSYQNEMDFYAEPDRYDDYGGAGIAAEQFGPPRDPGTGQQIIDRPPEPEFGSQLARARTVVNQPSYGDELYQRNLAYLRENTPNSEARNQREARRLTDLGDYAGTPIVREPTIESLVAPAASAQLGLALRGSGLARNLLGAGNLSDEAFMASSAAAEAGSQIAPEIARDLGASEGMQTAAGFLGGGLAGGAALRGRAPVSSMASAEDIARGKPVTPEVVDRFRNNPELLDALNSINTTSSRRLAPSQIQGMRDLLDAAQWDSTGIPSRVVSRVKSLQEMINATIEGPGGPTVISPNTAARGAYERGLEQGNDPGLFAETGLPPQGATLEARRAAAAQGESNIQQGTSQAADDFVRQVAADAMEEGAVPSWRQVTPEAEAAARRRFESPPENTLPPTPRYEPDPNAPLLLPEGRGLGRVEGEGFTIENWNNELGVYVEGRGQPMRPQPPYDPTAGVEGGFRTVGDTFPTEIGPPEPPRSRPFGPAEPPFSQAIGPASPIDDVRVLWENTTRALTPANQNQFQQGLNLLKSALAGEFRDPYIQFLHERRQIAENMLIRAGVSEKTAQNVAEKWVLNEATSHRGNFTQAQADIDTIKANNTATGQTLQDYRTFLTLTQRVKNTMFGLADFGVFGVQVLNTAREGSIPVFAGIANKALSALHAPGARDLYGQFNAPKEQIRLNDGFRPRQQNIRQSGVDPKVGSLLSYIPVIGKPLDAIPKAISDAATTIQFDGIMGALRSLAYEGNLWIADISGQDISNVAVRRTAFNNAEAITSGAKTAATANRSVAENALLTTAQMTRSQINRVMQMTKLVRPDATLAERQVAATMILSNVAFVGLVGTALNEAIGVGDYELNPFKPGFGTITTKWKDEKGRNMQFNLMSQASTEKALVSTIKDALAVARGESEGGGARDAWTKYGISRAAPLINSGLRMGLGVGYGPGGRFSDDITPPWDTGYGMPLNQRIGGSLPIPLNIQRAAPKLGDSLLAAARGERIPDPTEGGASILSPEFGVQTFGFNEYPESAFAEFSRRKDEALQGAIKVGAIPEAVGSTIAGLESKDLTSREKAAMRGALGEDFQKRYAEDVSNIPDSRVSDYVTGYFAVTGRTAQTARENKAKYLDLLEREDPKLGAAVRAEVTPDTTIGKLINGYYEVKFENRPAFLKGVLREYGEDVTRRLIWNTLPKAKE